MNPNKKKNSATGVVDNEVEELLRAAQDEALLKLSINAHTVKPSSTDLDPELNQRFRALRSGSKPSAKTEVLTKRVPPSEATSVKEVEGEDDLFARFSALKASVPKPSSSTSAFAPDANTVGKDNIVVDDEEEEDEVEKLIRWAMDAARLDPSPPSDDEDVIEEDNYDESENSDDDDEKCRRDQSHK